MSMKSYIKHMVMLFLMVFSAAIHADAMRLSADLIPNWDPLMIAQKLKSHKDTMEIKALQEGTPLWRHVQFFADKNSVLTRNSMKAPHDALGITANVELKMSVILNLLDRRQLPHTVDNLIPIYNPASSGLWDTNGHFIEEKFNQLAAQAVLDNGNQIITKDIFNHFLKTLPRDGTEKDIAATVPVGPFVVDITWQQVTMGSVNEIFEFLGDYTFKKNNKEEKAFTVGALRRFYEYPDEYMQNVIDKKSDSVQLALEKCPYKH